MRRGVWMEKRRGKRMGGRKDGQRSGWMDVVMDRGVYGGRSDERRSVWMDVVMNGEVYGWRGVVLIVGPLHPMHSDDHEAEYLSPFG
jgi:hypothetical protein